MLTQEEPTLQALEEAPAATTGKPSLAGNNDFITTEVGARRGRLAFRDSPRWRHVGYHG